MRLFMAFGAGLVMVVPIAALLIGLAGLVESYPTLRFLLLAIATFLTILQSLICLADISGFQADLRYRQIRSFLQQPFEHWSVVGLNSEQGIISLSYLSEGLVSYSIRRPFLLADIVPLAKKAVEIAIAVAPFDDVNKKAQWGKEGLYLSHLNVILGAYQRLTGEQLYLTLNRNISEYLSQRIIDDPNHNIHSYGSYAHVWFADNAVTLYSLYLFDKNNNTNLSQEPIQKWLKYMETEGTDPKTQLHYSELTRLEAYSRYPRGCALSWTTKYMSQFAPQEALLLWQNYKKHFKQSFLVFAGFREYPVGAPLEEDYDSGPILLGMGAAATGLALNGSKAIGDYLTYYQVINIVKAFEGLGIVAALLGEPIYKQLASDLKAVAISFQAEAFVPWF